MSKYGSHVVFEPQGHLTEPIWGSDLKITSHSQAQGRYLLRFDSPASITKLAHSHPLNRPDSSHKESYSQ